MRVLIAEDERITRRKLQRELQSWGFDVATVENGAEAWELCQERSFDLVVSDWEMPKMNGPELVRQIRASTNESYTYVILLTARSQTEDIVEGMDAGADDFVSKPFDRHELRARVRAGERILQLERRLALHNQRMKNDLQAAARYVRSLIPEPSAQPVKIDWRYLPSADLGGDVLGYHWLDEDHLALYLVDVTGHGLDSAFLAVTVMNVLRSQSLPGTDFHEPGQVLGALNLAFPMEKYGEKMFTIWYGVLQRSTSELCWSGGGHPPALLFEGEEKEPVRLESEGPMIGMMPWPEFTSTRSVIRVPTRLYLYSDGVHEIRKTDGQMWSFDEFVEFLSGCDPQRSSVADQLLDQARALRGIDQLDDDFSILEVLLPDQQR